MVRLGSGDARRAIGRIQRLCCLGLGGQALVPPLLRELPVLVPSFSGMFFWAGPRQELTNVYCTLPTAHLIPIYLDEFHNLREREFLYTFTETMRTHYPTAAGHFHERTLKVDLREYTKTDLYNLCEIPVGGGPRLQLKVTDCGRVLGALHINRQTKEREFTGQDIRLLEAISGFVAHGMTRVPIEEGFVASEDRALVIVDHAGKLQHASPEAHQLMMMALHPRWAPDTRCRMLMSGPQPEITHLCRLLLAATTGALPNEPPICKRRNAWGEFVFRAYWLEPMTDCEPCRFIGITIERREPRSLALLRKVEALRLSEREKQLCLLLARGNDTADAAQAMGVTEHTVITHRRNLYTKLSVESRMALIDRLHVG